MVDLTGFACVTKPCTELTSDERAVLLELFAAAYRDANAAYLEKSFGQLKYVAIATHGDIHVGFALGEMRIMDLPRLPDEGVAMAGICCVLPNYRRRGLFGQLERLTMTAAGIERRRWLACGRTAHPASMRTMRANPTTVPRPGVRPSDWQRAVGQAIADAYGVYRFDPDTFVCVGSGAPIGYPIMEIEVTPEEWEPFRNVDRSRGDSLLGISWWGEPPEGW